MARVTRVVDTWDRAVMLAHAYAYQTGWRYAVRRVPLTTSYRVARTAQRVRHRCSPERERALGRHST